MSELSNRNLENLCVRLCLPGDAISSCYDPVFAKNVFVFKGLHCMMIKSPIVLPKITKCFSIVVMLLDIHYSQ